MGPLPLAVGSIARREAGCVAGSITGATGVAALHLTWGRHGPVQVRSADPFRATTRRDPAHLALDTV
jgi:hypothetical protein